MQADTSISINEAIKRGRRILLLPRILLAIGAFYWIFSGWIYLEMWINSPPGSIKLLTISGAVWIVAFFPMIWLPFWFWSKRTTKWKLWAFDQVADVHELKRQAMRAALYADDGTFLNRLQIRSADEDERWAALQYKLRQKPLFTDDDRIPVETVIRISPYKTAFSVIACLIPCVLGAGAIYLSFHVQKSPWISFVIGIALTVYGSVFIYQLIRDLIANKPQIIINNKGITTLTSGFHSWDTIRNESIRYGNSVKGNRRTFLHYDYWGGTTDFEIASLAISNRQLENLLVIYRGRYEAFK